MNAKTAIVVGERNQCADFTCRAISNSKDGKQPSKWWTTHGAGEGSAVGITSACWTEIVSGLSEGEKVVEQ